MLFFYIRVSRSVCVIVDGIVITVTSQKNRISCFKENADRHVNTNPVNYLSLGA